MIRDFIKNGEDYPSVDQLTLMKVDSYYCYINST